MEFVCRSQTAVSVDGAFDMYVTTITFDKWSTYISLFSYMGCAIIQR